MPVRVRDRTFPSAKACAAHFGIKVSAVYSLISRGRADMIGLGKGWVRKGADTSPNAKPVVIGPLSFRSYREADRAFGVSNGFTWKCMHSIRNNSPETLVPHAMAYQARMEKERTRLTNPAFGCRGGLYQEEPAPCP